MRAGRTTLPADNGEGVNGHLFVGERRYCEKDISGFHWIRAPHAAHPRLVDTLTHFEHFGSQIYIDPCTLAPWRRRSGSRWHGQVSALQ